MTDVKENEPPKRTRLEKMLFALVGFLALFIFSLIVSLSVLSIRSRTKNANPVVKVCQSNSCKRTGEALRYSVDLKVDPCQNFYSYCCDGWLKSHHVPGDVGLYGVSEKLREDVVSKLNGLLSADISSANVTSVKNALKFYGSCMDTTTIENRGNAPLLQLLSELGGWPVVNDTWVDTSYNWLSAVAQIQRTTGFGFIISIIIAPDAKNTSSNILQLDEPSISLSRGILLNPNKEANKKELDSFRKFFTTIATLLGADGRNLTDDFDGIVRFERELAERMRSDEDKRVFNSWYNKMNVEELQRNISQIDWLWFLQEVTNSTLVQRRGEDAVITRKEMIIVRELNYLQEVIKYLNDEASPRQIANYLGWRVIMSKMRHLPSKFGEALQNYSIDTGFSQTAPERWKVCSNLANTVFAYVTAFLYVREYFPKDVKNEILTLVEDIRSQFKSLLDKNEWMDKATKSAALRKLNAMKSNIGYPDWITDVHQLDQHYIKSGMPNMTDNVFEDDLAISKYTTMTAIEKLRKENHKSEWPMMPVTVNAAYNRNSNSITFPAAFLQWPLYDPYLPRYYNYAAIGAVIGHEITHGFDNEGSHRNETGEVHDWWSREAKNEFDKRTQCFVDQYNQFKIKGKQTLAENIADNGGLRQAYQAFSKWRNKNKDIERLPGFQHFTPDQLFFLSYGSIWCTKYRTGILNYTIANAEHAPSEFRLHGTVSNLEAFSDAFHCGKESSLSPKNRCIIW